MTVRNANMDKVRAEELKKNTAYMNEFNHKMAELKAKHAKEVAATVVTPEQIQRNEVLAKEIWLSIGRFKVRKRMKLNGELLQALKKAMMMGVDLNDEEARNKVNSQQGG